MVILISNFASAYDGIVEKKVFTMPSYTTTGGKVIKNVRIGYEHYGKLNEKKDNVILITHFFSGNSHAAGKYKEADPMPGYWDSIIGSGKPFDTDRYFVISSDALVNTNVKDGVTVTTGPASINPDTGKPYAMNFPIVTIRDFVNVQKALLDSLGINKLKVVAGPSGGSIQAIEWSVAYPEMVEKVIASVSPGLDIPPYAIANFYYWMAPIMASPDWKEGNYYDSKEPTDGLILSLSLATWSALHFGWAEKSFGNTWANPDKDPKLDFKNTFAIEAAFKKSGTERAKITDPNSFLYACKAYQVFSVVNEIKKIKAKFLFTPASSDLIFPTELSKRAVEKLRENGNYADLFEIQGTGGHFDGLAPIAQASDKIREFLEK